MFTGKEKNREYFKNKIFVGLVEDVRDKRRKGRIRVRVQGVFDQIPTEHIPWASPTRSTDGKYFNVPAVGKIVNVIFVDGNIYEPQYIYSENYNINLQNKIDELSADEYSNFFAALFDHRTQIYSDDQKLMMDFYHNNINIKQDSINLNLKDNNQKLNLGNNAATQSAVLGDHFLEWFDEFINTLLNPSSLTGNIGAPILKPQLDSVMTKYQALRRTFLSEHVKIVDNAKCADNEPDRKSAPTKDDFTKFNEKTIIEESPARDKIIENRVKEDVKSQINEPVNPVTFISVDPGLDGPPDEDDDKISNVSTGTTIIAESEDEWEEDKVNETTGEVETFKRTIIRTEKTVIGGEEDLTKKDLTPEEMDNLGLSETQKSSLNAQSEMNYQRSQGTSQPTASESNTDDPYGGFWAGRQGKTAEELNNTSPVYGAYTYTYTGKEYKVGEAADPSYAVSTCSSDSGGYSATIYDQDSTDPTKNEQKMKIPPPLVGTENGKLDTSKLKRIPDQYCIGVPRYLESEACNQLLAMIDAAKSESVDIKISSAYRSYEQQVSISGMQGAAGPGHSPHGLACAIDINGIQKYQKEYMSSNGQSSYVTEAAGNYARNKSDLFKWLDKNGPKFGWYNPWRLKVSKGCNEAWHFEYWGYWKQGNDTASPPSPSSNSSIYAGLCSTGNGTGGYSMSDDGQLGNPCIGKISSKLEWRRFGSQNPHFHPGVDIAASKGTAIWSVYSGNVAECTTWGDGCSVIQINHNVNGNQIQSVYLHWSKSFIKKGDKVSKGQKIAEVGDVGSPNTFHLHFELWNGVRTTDKYWDTSPEPFNGTTGPGQMNYNIKKLLDPTKLVNGLGTVQPVSGCDTAGVTAAGTSTSTSTNAEDNIKNMILVMKGAGYTNPYWMAGILSCVYKETAFVAKSEYSYGKTSAQRIRNIFGNKRKGLHPKSLGEMTDAEIEALSKNDVKFYDLIYGGQYGNTKSGDGYKYRGRGYNGITFKDQYKQYSDLIGIDLLSNPDAINEPTNAAKCLAEYFKREFNRGIKGNHLDWIPGGGVKSLDDINSLEKGCTVAVACNSGVGKHSWYNDKNSINYKGLQSALSVSSSMLDKVKKYSGGTPIPSTSSYPITSCGTMGAGDTAGYNSGTIITGGESDGGTNTTTTTALTWIMGYTVLKTVKIGDIIYCMKDNLDVPVGEPSEDVDEWDTKVFNNNDRVGTFLSQCAATDEYAAGNYIYLKDPYDDNMQIFFPTVHCKKKS